MTVYFSAKLGEFLADALNDAAHGGRELAADLGELSSGEIVQEGEARRVVALNALHRSGGDALDSAAMLLVGRPHIPQLLADRGSCCVQNAADCASDGR